MSKSKNQQQAGESQIDRFKQAARELGCDESAAAFDEKIKAIVKKKPQAPDKDQAASKPA